MRYLILGVLLVGVLLVSCEKEAPLSNNGTSGLNQQLLLDLVNDARTNGCTCGTTAYPAVAPVVWDSSLAAVAQEHSDDMAANNNMSHTGSDGSSAKDRLNRAGISWNSYGENVSRGHEDETAVIQAWLNSTGHCQNIMSSSKRKMGVAETEKYWTQIFTN